MTRASIRMAFSAGLPVGAATLFAAAVSPVDARAISPLGAPSPLVAVGNGVSESSQRQLVRTSAGRVYIVSIDDDGVSGGMYSRLHVYRADALGVPSAFALADRAHEPSVVAPASLSGGDSRLDHAGIIHITYFNPDSDRVLYRTFSTATDRWGPPAEVVATLPALGQSEGTRGRVIGALALDPSGRPLVVTASSAGVSAFVRGAHGAWRMEWHRAEDSLHPSLAFDQNGRAHLAWLQGPFGAPAIRYSTRAPGGGWAAPETIAASGVLDNSSNDQSPSLALDARDHPVVAFLDPLDHVRTSARADSGAWTADDPAPAVYTHDPAIYLRGNDRIVGLGHDAAIHPAYISRRASDAAWSGITEFRPPGATAWQYDGSASIRWDPINETNCRIVDFTFMSENVTGGPPDLHYAAITLGNPPGGCPGPAHSAPAHCTVPRVMGLKLSRARARLRRAGCRLGKVSRPRHRGGRLRIVAQHPRPGTLLPRRAAIRVRLARR